MMTFKEMGKWLDKAADKVLSFTDLNDATVLVTHFTRNGNAINVDGSLASKSDKYWAAGGALLPAVSGSAAKKIFNAITNIRANQAAGAAREVVENVNLEKLHPGASVQGQQYLRNADGKIAKDPLTGEGVE
jgi:hypothetical protein